MSANLTKKSDIGDYSYPLTQPHAVGTVTQGDKSNTYTYDANGNMGSSTDTDLPTSTWASYNKPTNISLGTNSYDFKYGPDRNRYEKIHTTSSTTTRTHYLGDMEIIYGTSTEYRYLIRAAGTVIAVLKDTGTTSTDYIHRDHLSSLTTITNSSGAVQERLAYDAWGQKRDATDWDGTATATEKRGFTGHEHMDDVGIIHMNVRVYAPKLGRFLSPDPVTSAPENGQNYNRYAYVYNNPLRYSDPSGYVPTNVGCFETITCTLGTILSFARAFGIGGGCSAACQYQRRTVSWCESNDLCTKITSQVLYGSRTAAAVQVYEGNYDSAVRTVRTSRNIFFGSGSFAGFNFSITQNGESTPVNVVSDEEIARGVVARTADMIFRDIRSGELDIIGLGESEVKGGFDGIDLIFDSDESLPY